MDIDFKKVNTLAIDADDSEPSIYYGPALDPVMCGKPFSEMKLTFVLDTNLYSDICHKNTSLTFRHFLMLAERYQIMIDPSFGVSEQVRVSQHTARTHLKNYRKHLSELFSVELPLESQEKLLESANNLCTGMKYNVRLLESFLSIIKYIYQAKGDFEKKKSDYLKITSSVDLPQFGFILACGYLLWKAKDRLQNNNVIRKKIDAFMSMGKSAEKENKILHNAASDISLFHSCLDVFNLKYAGTQEFPILATRDTVVGFLLKHLCFSHVFDKIDQKYKAGLFLRPSSPWYDEIKDDFYIFISQASKPLSQGTLEQRERLKNLEQLRAAYFAAS